MGKRRQRGPSKQKKVTLPLLLWELLEDHCELQTEAYAKLGGGTVFTISDLLEAGAGIFLRDVAKDIGPPPPRKAPDAVRDAYVKKLAEYNRRELIADIYQDAPKLDD